MMERDEERKMWEAITRSTEYRLNAEGCLPQELEIQAVVGAKEFTASRLGKVSLWKASIELTAWKEEGGEIHREESYLSTPADDSFLDYLEETVKTDSVIRCRVLLPKKGSYLFMTGPVQEGDDPELKEILKEQVREVIMEVEGLGRFVLNRRMNWFETKTDWMGTEIALSFDRDVEKVMEDGIKTARILMGDQGGWDRRIREYAADELLELANEWAEDAMGEEWEKSGEDDQLVSREQFMERMELKSIEALEKGEFEFWFSDGDMFFGHSIHVIGNVEDGPDWTVDIEG